MTINNRDLEHNNNLMASTKDLSGGEENSNKKVIDQVHDDRSDISIEKLIQNIGKNNDNSSAELTILFTKARS